MALDFPHVALLGLTQDSRFFQAGFQYSSLKRLSIQGLVTDLANGFGISGIWTGQEGILNTVRNNTNFQDLSLNGISFGSGRIQNITFDNGNDVKTKNYHAELIVYDSGNLFNATGFFYSGLDLSNFQYLESFSEDYAFDKKQNGGYHYTHTASIRFNSGVGQLNAIQAAQSLARTLFTGSNLGLAFYSGYTNKQGKRYTNESYSLLDNATTFAETFDFDNDLGPYSATRTVNVNQDDNGVILAVERAQIRGIENPNYQVALSVLGIEMTGAYFRCSGAVTNYFPSGATLITSPITQGRTVDIFNNNIGYTVTFNNSPTNSGFFTWDYTQQVGYQEGVATITENGTIQGRGENKTSAFNSAQSGLNLTRASLISRIDPLFTMFLPSTHYLENKRETYSPYQSQCGYSYAYSNNPSLISNTGVRRRQTTVENGVPIYHYNHVNIFNYKEIVQNDYQSTVGSSTINVTMEGDKTVGLQPFLDVARAEILARMPTGQDPYVGEASYTYEPNSNGSAVRTTWVFNQSAAQTLYP